MIITVTPENEQERSDIEAPELVFTGVYEFALIGRKHPEGAMGRAFAHTHNAGSLIDQAGDMFKALAEMLAEISNERAGSE